MDRWDGNPSPCQKNKQNIKYADSRLITATSVINNYRKVQTKGRLGPIKDTKEIIAFAKLMISFFDSVAEHLWCRQGKLLKNFSIIILFGLFS